MNTFYRSAARGTILAAALAATFGSATASARTGFVPQVWFNALASVPVTVEVDGRSQELYFDELEPMQQAAVGAVIDRLGTFTLAERQRRGPFGIDDSLSLDMPVAEGCFAGTSSGTPKTSLVACGLGAAHCFVVIKWDDLENSDAGCSVDDDEDAQGSTSLNRLGRSGD